MVTVPYVAPIEVEYGVAEHVSPLVRRVVARNPSKFTYRGTGTYIVGQGDVAVIDPGPDLTSHREALARTLATERVRAILVTHCHADHSPLARWLSSWSGAPTYAFGPHPPPDADDERDDHADSVGTDGQAKLEEAVDLRFSPSEPCRDGDVIDGPGWTFDAVFTPGHTSNHTCWALREESTLFSGDHVMGWSTTVISPPDGDMRTYMESLHKVAARGSADAVYRPTHGGPITDPPSYVHALIEHRLEREHQVLDVVRQGIAEIPDMVKILYADVREELHKPAARSVLSHLVKLVADGAVGVEGGGRPRSTSRFVG